MIEFVQTVEPESQGFFSEIVSLARFNDRFAEMIVSLAHSNETHAGNIHIHLFFYRNRFISDAYQSHVNRM